MRPENNARPFHWLPDLSRSLFQNSPCPRDGGVALPLRSLFALIPKPNSLLLKSMRISPGSQSHQAPLRMLCKLRFCSQDAVSSYNYLSHKLSRSPHLRRRHRRLGQLFEVHKGFASAVLAPQPSSLIKCGSSSATCQALCPDPAGVGESKTEPLCHGACHVKHPARTSGNEVRMPSVPLENPGPLNLSSFQIWPLWHLLPPHWLRLLEFLLPNRGHLSNASRKAGFPLFEAFLQHPPPPLPAEDLVVPFRQ